MTEIGQDEKIAIIGSYPPPYGGVGIGVKRLADLLESLSIPYVVYNTVSDVEIPDKVVSVAKQRRFWSFRYLLTCRERAVIVRTSNIYGYALGALLYVLKKKPTAIFFGNVVYPRLAVDRSRSLAGRLIRWTVRHAYLMVGVSEQVCETLVAIGAPDDRVRYIPGFLLPKSKFCVSQVDETVERFLKSHHPTLLALATSFACDDKQRPIYGIDLMLEAVDRLRQNYPNIGLLLIIPARDEEIERNCLSLKGQLEKRGLSELILPYLMSNEMFPLFSMVDIHLRPTRTDGDANSVREALYAGVPVLASDAAPRPEGTVVYPTEDINAFVEALDEIIVNLATYKEKVSRIDVKDSSEKYIQLIHELLA